MRDGFSISMKSVWQRKFRALSRVVSNAAQPPRGRLASAIAHYAFSHVTWTGMFKAGLLRTFAAVSVVVISGEAAAFAQTEDIEPRAISQRGATLVGMSGSLSRFFSSEDFIAGSYIVQVDGHHFVLDKIAIRFGLVGTGRFGGPSSDDDDEQAGPGTPSLEALGGALYYFTPESIWSLYGGAEYRARLTERVEGDSGSIIAIAGLQGALSSRASFFLEGGYGMRVRRGNEGELLTRMVGQVGVRFKF